MEIGFGSCFATRSCQLLVKSIVSLEEEEIVTVFCKSKSDCCANPIWTFQFVEVPTMRNLFVFQPEVFCKSYATNTTVKHRDFFWLDFFVKFTKFSTIFFRKNSITNLSNSKQFKL